MLLVSRNGALKPVDCSRPADQSQSYTTRVLEQHGSRPQRCKLVTHTYTYTRTYVQPLDTISRIAYWRRRDNKLDVRRGTAKGVCVVFHRWVVRDVRRLDGRQ